jgi:hypothetical protein
VLTVFTWFRIWSSGGFNNSILRVKLVGKPEGKRPVESLWRRLEDNIRIDVRERRW